MAHKCPQKPTNWIEENAPKLARNKAENHCNFCAKQKLEVNT